MANVVYDESKKKWRFDRGGRRNRSRTWHNTRQEALDLKREYQVLRANLPPSALPTTRTRLTIDEVVDRYISTITIRKSKYSQYYEPMMLKDFQDFFRGKFIQEIGLADLERYFVHLEKDKGLLPQSQKRRRNTLSHMFRKSVDWELIEKNPFSRLELGKDANLKPRRALTLEELTVFFRACKPWLRNVAWLGLETGLRRTQLAELCWRSIDFDGRFLRLESHNDKSRKLHSLPMTEQVFRLLSALHEAARIKGLAGPDHRVFLDDRSEPIRPDRLTHETKKVMKRHLGIHSGGIHLFRHTSITLRHRQGVSLDTVRAIAGHADVKTTQRYLHCEPEYLRQELSRTTLFPLEGFGKSVALGGTKEKLSTDRK